MLTEEAVPNICFSAEKRIKTKCKQAVGRRPPQCLRPLQVDSIFVFICQVAGLFRHNNIRIYSPGGTYSGILAI